jgi:hypothetical protein
MRLPKGPDIKFRLPKGPSLKGPSLKAPAKPKFLENVKVPPVVADLYRDMRDRHLLPLVVVAALGIVAVPLLLSESAPELSETQGASGIPVIPSTGEPPKLTVVADSSGLRDYRKRLRHLESKNPFRQHFSSPQISGAQLGGSSGGATSTVSTTPTPSPGESFSGTTTPEPSFPVDVQSYDGQDPVGPPGSGNGNGNGNGGGAEVNADTDFVSYEVDVKIVRPPARAGGNRKAKESIRRGIAELEMLPSEKSPVVVFMGVTGDAKKALFLLSDRVTSVFGDATCRVGSDSCQLLAIEPGLPVTFVYGAEDKRIRLNVLDIERVTREKP